MKKLLGAIAAALVLGAGCAHDQEKTARTEAPSTGQARVGDSVALSGLDCEVISTGGSGAAGSGTIQNEPSASVTTGSATEQSKCVPGKSSASTDTQDKAIGGSASEDLAIGGSASQGAAPSDSAKDDAAFEKTDMGGTGGGGG